MNASLWERKLKTKLEMQVAVGGIEGRTVQHPSPSTSENTPPQMLDEITFPCKLVPGRPKAHSLYPAKKMLACYVSPALLCSACACACGLGRNVSPGMAQRLLYWNA
jgi:hypothetical protein